MARLEDGGVRNHRNDSGIPQFFAGPARLLPPGFGERYVGPTGEAVLPIPDALPVAEEDQNSFGDSFGKFVRGFVRNRSSGRDERDLAGCRGRRDSELFRVLLEHFGELLCLPVVGRPVIPGLARIEYPGHNSGALTGNVETEDRFPAEPRPIDFSAQGPPDQLARQGEGMRSATPQGLPAQPVFTR